MPNDIEPNFLVRLIILEKQVENFEKTYAKTNDTISELMEKINNIKYNCQSANVSKDTVANIEKDLKELEEKVANIKIDISEITFFKKIGWLVISFIIVSLLGFILNVSVFNKSPSTDPIIGQKLDDISQKLSREYKKQE